MIGSSWEVSEMTGAFDYRDIPDFDEGWGYQIPDDLLRLAELLDCAMWLHTKFEDSSESALIKPFGVVRGELRALALQYAETHEQDLLRGVGRCALCGSTRAKLPPPPSLSVEYSWDGLPSPEMKKQPSAPLSCADCDGEMALPADDQGELEIRKLAWERTRGVFPTLSVVDRVCSNLVWEMRHGLAQSPDALCASADAPLEETALTLTKALRELRREGEEITSRFTCALAKYDDPIGLGTHRAILPFGTTTGELYADYREVRDKVMTCHSRLLGALQHSPSMDLHGDRMCHVRDQWPPLEEPCGSGDGKSDAPSHDSGLVTSDSMPSACSVEDDHSSEALKPAFPIPSDKSWRDITIRFVDGETVSISVGDIKNDKRSMAELGFARKKNRKPTTAWEDLRRFAEAESNIVSVRDFASSRVKRPAATTRMTRLSNLLKSCFGIESNPFHRQMEQPRNARPRLESWQSLIRLIPEDLEM